jgi:hypothetical protein
MEFVDVVMTDVDQVEPVLLLPADRVERGGSFNLRENL